MKFSVVIPSFNDPRIIDTIQSVDHQAFDRNDVEICVQDGGSKSDVLDAIKGALRPQDKLAVERDNGIFDGINKGIQNSTGDYVLTVGSDDRFFDDRYFSRLEASFAAGNNFVMCDMLYVDDEWTPVRFWPARNFNWFNYLIGRQFCHFSMACSRDVYREVGLFNVDNRVNADFEFFFECLRRPRFIKYDKIDVLGVQMKMGGNSSRNLSSIMSANMRILRFIVSHRPAMLPGFLLLKPIHKLVELRSAKRFQ